MEKRYPIPPFTAETAFAKIQMAKNDQINEQEVDLYAIESEWRNHSEFIRNGRYNSNFPMAKWQRETDCKYKMEHWAYTENRIAVRFEYEYQDEQGRWYKTSGNENWEFDADGIMVKRSVTINDMQIEKKNVKIVNQ